MKLFNTPIGTDIVPVVFSEQQTLKLDVKRSGLGTTEIIKLKIIICPSHPELLQTKPTFSNTLRNYTDRYMMLKLRLTILQSSFPGEVNYFPVNQFVLRKPVSLMPHVFHYHHH